MQSGHHWLKKDGKLSHPKKKCHISSSLFKYVKNSYEIKMHCNYTNHATIHKSKDNIQPMVIGTWAKPYWRGQSLKPIINSHSPKHKTKHTMPMDNCKIYVSTAQNLSLSRMAYHRLFTTFQRMDSYRDRDSAHKKICQPRVSPTTRDWSRTCTSNCHL